LVTFDNVPVDERSRSLIVLFEPDHKLAVLDLKTSPMPQAVDRVQLGGRELKVHALVYTSSLAELMIDPTLDPKPADGCRPLPPSTSVWSATSGGGPASGWNPEDFGHVPQAGVPAPMVNTCADGCVVGARTDEPAVACGCHLPAEAVCKPQSVTATCSAPTMPSAAAPPAPPQVTCPAGWTADASTPPVCAPAPLPELQTCPDGQVQLYGGGCGVFESGSDCPASEWRTDIIAMSGLSILYIRDGAAPAGDGSMLAPYATNRRSQGRAS
jgi:hypothetical protein